MTKPLNDKTTYAPFLLYSDDEQPDQFTLLLSDMSITEELINQFDEYDRQGGGYGWSDITLYVVAQDPTISADDFDMDPEAGMFVAYGKDLPTLKALAKALHHLFHNKEALNIALKEAPFEYD